MKSFWRNVDTVGTTITAYGRKYIYLGPCLITRRLKAKVRRSDTRIIKIPMRHVTHINEISQCGICTY